jgi:hypothetical protein
MSRYKVILPWMLLAAAVCSAAAAPGHYAISTDQIAATMSRFGMQIAPDQVKLLTDVVSTTTDPRLAVRSIQPWGNQRMMVRLECESREQCLPFFVGLQIGQGSDTQSSASASQHGSNFGPASTASSKNYAVRSGSPATLQLDGERVHIRISVICLENGAPGQTIRVTGKDHRLVYSAQVMGGGQLQGRL